MIRPSRVLAIAKRDLAVELAGRQGLLLPAVMAGLLLPASLVPSPMRDVASSYDARSVSIVGDVPPEVIGADNIDPDSRFPLTFIQTPDVLLVDGSFVPQSIRDRLDASDTQETVVPLERTPRGFRFPGRTALLALISASTLTGAVSQSIGGERQRRTLVVLMAAAISRAEIVLGKWLAWGGLGALSALLGAAVALLLGHVQPGAWLIPLPTVPFATVALGLWLVRRASDVMAGSATALRVLPATFSVLGVVAWFAGDSNPWLGAAIPLGGALLAAGQTWPELGPTLFATASTLLFAIIALAATIRDLQESPDRNPPEDRTLLTLGTAVLALSVWWLPIGGPVLWDLAGNSKITDMLPLQSGVLAGGLALMLFSIIRVARGHNRAAVELSAGSLDTKTALLTAVALVALLGISFVSPSLGTWLPLQFGDEAIRQRLADALDLRSVTLSTAILVIVADELLFRGWLQRAAGPGRALFAWTLVKAPLDPLSGILTGLVCTSAAAASGSVWPSLLARLALLFVV